MSFNVFACIRRCTPSVKVFESRFQEIAPARGASVFRPSVFFVLFVWWLCLAFVFLHFSYSTVVLVLRHCCRGHALVFSRRLSKPPIGLVGPYRTIYPILAFSADFRPNHLGRGHRPLLRFQRTLDQTTLGEAIAHCLI